MGRGGSWLEAILATAFFALLPAAFLPEVASMRGIVVQHDGGASDLYHHSFPCRAELARALKHGDFPLWTDGIYTGYPFAAQIENGVFYPLNWVLYGLLPLLPAQNLSTLIPFFIAGLGLYVFARLLGLSRTGSIIAAIAFAYGAFFTGRIKHMNTVDAAAWAPWILAALEHGLQRKRGRWFVVAGWLLALQALGGHPQIAYYTALVVVTYVGWRVIQDDVVRVAGARFRALLKLPLHPAVLYGVLMSFIAACIAVVQWWPTFELSNLSRRAGGVSYDFATNYAFHLPDLLTFVWPYFNGDPGRLTYDGTIFWENNGYFGLIPLLLAIVGIVLAALHDGRLRYFILLAVGGMLFVVGPHTPVYPWFYEHVPGFRLFRFPTRWMLFVHLALAVLAGYAWTRFAQWQTYLRSPFEGGVRREANGGCARTRPRLWISVAAAIVVVVTIIDLRYHQRRQIPIAEAEAWMTPPETVELVARDNPTRRYATLGGIESHRDAYEAAGGWQGDLTPYIEQRAMLQPSGGLLYDVNAADGYINLVPMHTTAILGDPAHEAGLLQESAAAIDGELQISGLFLRLLQMTSTHRLIGYWPVRDDVLPALKADGPPYVYDIPNVLPRARFVAEVVTVSDDEAVLGTLADPTFDPGVAAVIREDVALDRLEFDGDAALSVERYGQNEMAFKLRSAGPAFLVLAESYHPNWTVTIDGAPGSVFQVNRIQMGVSVPAGAESVTLQFEPTPNHVGAMISIAAVVVSLLGFAGALALQGRRV